MPPWNAKAPAFAPAARGETPAAFGRRCIPASPHRAEKRAVGAPAADCVAPPSNLPDIAPHRAQDARWGPRSAVVAPLRRGPHGADCAPWGGSAGRLAALGATPDFHHGLQAQEHSRTNISGLYSQLPWRYIGPEGNRVIAVAGVPGDPLVYYAGAASGGIWKTSDGGQEWVPVFDDQPVSAIGALAVAPSDPNIVWAGTGEAFIGWSTNISLGMGVYKSMDGGRTWKRVTSGMPKQEVGVGRVGVAIAPSNPNRMYALIETGDGIPWNGKATERGQIWRSDDGGETWRMINPDWSAMERTHYYTRIAVAPDNENETYYPTGKFSKSIDGGLTLVPQTRWFDAPATDHHDIWIDPINANRMIVGSDQGVSITLTRGAPNSWYRVRLPIAQMYHVTVDNQIPYKIYGNREDGPGYIGTSNSRRSASAEEPHDRGDRHQRRSAHHPEL